MHTSRILLRLAALFLPLVLAPATYAGVVVVNQSGNSFQPKDINVALGDTVTWQWSGGVHTVSEGTDGAVNGNEAFHSLLTSTVQSFSVVFDATFLAANPRPGNRYDYFCEPHFLVGMVGSVTVSACSPGTQVYCTAKVNSQGCTPAVGWSGAPSASAGSGFSITAAKIVPKTNGLFFYSKTGAAGNPFQGGTLCAASPIRRTSLQNSGGTAACSGQFAIDFNAWIAGGSDAGLIAGAKVWGQFWSRDPSASFGTNLTDAINFSICP